ncbi:Synaptotagmin-1 [Bienertia sinuspersici]
MMGFSINLIKFRKVFFTIQNSGAHDQDVLASPVRALAQIRTFMP